VLREEGVVPIINVLLPLLSPGRIIAPIHILLVVFLDVRMFFESSGWEHNCKRKYAHGYRGLELKVIASFVGGAGCTAEAHLHAGMRYTESAFSWMVRSRRTERRMGCIIGCTAA